MRCALRVVVVGLLAPWVRADTAALVAQKDNTLYEDAAGSLSNGGGQYLFTGLTLEPFARRALLRFDIGAVVPAGATITGATLRLTHSRGASSPYLVSVHRVLADWGEGASVAPAQEGTGIGAEPGDATWRHTFFPGPMWANPGGDFDPVESTSKFVGGEGTYEWPSTAALVADVNDMLVHPGANFGWVLLGDELSSPPTAKRFNSRENLDEATRPTLTLTYTVPAPGGAVAALAVGAVVLRRRRR